ncbi:hypothetical protein BO94DRAFT_557259 [Aspergillus sclerotioniger CBS 115572]|uniref:MARVEL domain-containing protein n=1 Tax=Aspergillus sclerotioniger CBS 115572 TaxID=1450535 RepID=A0A317WNL9_9EURO|nr:hypothetical protein BO94DRAFT_557259 [Aspergillus sclerotioniger CBS 115572]PWY85850.1 hypothetical protein BO94DRAFT_557259 [Aspergillus sclerotioniger CBS 115572]
MRLSRPSFNPGRTKNIIHGFQAFIIFLAWVLTIAVFTKGHGIDGREAWYWALCWFSIPGLIYLVAVPMWPRARRFGNVYAFATVDCLYAILWFTAWVCVASYVAEGKSKGKSDSSSSSTSTKRDATTTTTTASTSTSTSTKSGCDNWAYGSAGKCKLSTATVIMGVVIFLLFIVTAFMSFRNVAHFRRTGTLPDAVSDPTFAAQSKAAFNPAHDFEEEEDDFRSRAGIGSSVRGDRDEDYALLQQSEVDEFGNSQARSALSGTYDPTVSGGSVLHDYSTSYGGAHGQHYGTPSEFGTNETVKMTSLDLYTQYPLHLDPTTKSITLAPTTTPSPARSAQVTKLRDSANAAFRKSNHADAARLYTYAIDMAIGRPGWEPVTLAREELAGLYSNRAQAWMSQRKWPEGLVDARCSVESKPVGNVKAWWRGGRCLVEMGRWEEAKGLVEKGLEVEGRGGEGERNFWGCWGRWRRG